ncbi:hypothetical protein JW978_02325 [Candidatus Dojkabacteria bacterium]|nr:hypothetical protein [Candidatus Dojkabacteria bacterium]
MDEPIPQPLTADTLPSLTINDLINRRELYPHELTLLVRVENNAITEGISPRFTISQPPYKAIFEDGTKLYCIEITGPVASGETISTYWGCPKMLDKYELKSVGNPPERVNGARA